MVEPTKLTEQALPDLCSVIAEGKLRPGVIHFRYGACLEIKNVSPVYVDLETNWVFYRDQLYVLADTIRKIADTHVEMYGEE